MGELIYNPDEVEATMYQGRPAPAAPANVPPQNTGFARLPVEDDDTFNLSEASDELPAFELLPKMTYECEIESTAKEYSSNGKPMLAIRFRIIEPLEYQNKVIFWRIVPGTPFGLTRLKQFISRTGLSKSVDMNTFKLGEFADSGLAIGKTCKIVLDIKPYKKKDGSQAMGNNVKDILPSGGQDFLVTK